jgi:hypothetical protein
MGLDDDVHAVLQPQSDDDADGLLREGRAFDAGTQGGATDPVDACGDGGRVAGREDVLLDGGVTRSSWRSIQQSRLRA